MKDYSYLDHVKKSIYDNCSALDKDGNLMFRCRFKKAKWYLDRNLAVIVQENPLIIQLNFDPKGIGCQGDEYSLSIKRNICVVCGETSNLSRHHVVPYCYRKNMHDHPGYVSDHHDIVALCVTCHAKYEKEADKFKMALADKYNAPLAGIGIDTRSPRITAIRSAGSLLFYPNIPPDRISFLIGSIRNFLGHDPSKEEIKSLANEKPNSRTAYYKTHGELVVSRVEDYFEFIKEWRRHFLRKMNPKFMPRLWSVTRPILET